MFKKIVYSLQFTVYSLFSMLFTVHCSLFTVCFAQEQNKQESDQQISEFSLAGFGKKGEKSWDISGKTADIFEEMIKLKDVVGNLYREQEDIKLTAERGDFNKTDGSVHLEDNVVITTSQGAKLTTDSLDWDRKKQIVMTQDLVNIERQNLVATASGATGEPDLHKVTLQKDVQVEILPVEAEKKSQKTTQNKTVITCNGPLQIDYEKNIATFNENVKVDREDLQIFSDVMDVYFLASSEDKTAGGSKDARIMGSKIDRIICKGNVKIVRQENVSFSDEAIYSAADKKIILSGKPKLIIASTEEFNASFGN